MNMSLLELWGTMGWFARGIIAVLLLMSISVAAVAISKAHEYRRSRRATLQFSRLLSEALRKRDFARAGELVDRYPNSHLAASLRRVLASSKIRRAERGVLTAEEIAGLERTAELGALECIARFKQGLGVLATTGATAPFVGLLGTVVGVVNAFSGMAAAGGGGIAVISAGIAEALVATAVGLLVAIPAVWLYNYFTNRIEFIAMELTYAMEELVTYVSDPLDSYDSEEGIREKSKVAMSGELIPVY